jgi:hypothetical protein
MANSMASILIKPTIAFNRGDTFVFDSWVCTADGAGSFQLSVRNVVPTLTSRKRQGLSLDGRCQATKDTSFILVPAGAVRPAEVCSWHYIALHRGACSGAATSKAGEEAWPPSPKRSGWRCCGRIEECVRDVVSNVRVSMSLRRGGSPSFYRPRRGRFTGMPHYLATGGGMACSPESRRPS